MITLTEYEASEIVKNPDALRALASQHECWEVEADAIGDFAAAAAHHARRARELKAEADRLDAEA